jgi:hypothetical protein
MKLLLYILLMTCLALGARNNQPPSKQTRIHLTGRVVVFDRMEVDDRGFAKLYLNGTHFLTCWEENLSEN